MRVAKSAQSKDRAASRERHRAGRDRGEIAANSSPELAACRDVKRLLPGGLLRTGGAVITSGFRLPARHVIHCVGPIYDREGSRAPQLLASCYTEALRLCRQHGLSSIAFPAISTGIYGYPLDEAARVSLTAVRDDLLAHGSPQSVKIVLFGRDAFSAFARAASAAF